MTTTTDDVCAAEDLARAGDLAAAARRADAVLEAGEGEGLPADRARAARVLATVFAHHGQLARSAQLHAWAAEADPGSASPAAAVAAAGAGTVPHVAVDASTVPTARAGADELTASGLLASVRGTSCTALSDLTRAAALLACTGAAVLPDDTPAALASLVALHRGEAEMGRVVLERAIEADLGGIPFRRRHRLLHAWTRMVEGDEAEAHAGLAAAREVPGATGARDDLVAVGLEAALARRAGDTRQLLALWARCRAAVLQHPVDLYALLPLGELLIVGARLGEGAWLRPHVQAADALLDALGSPALWACPWHWAGLLAALAAEDRDDAGHHAQRLAAYHDSGLRAAVLSDAAALWLEVLDGRVEPVAVTATATALQGAGLARDGARLTKEAAVRTSDRKAISLLLNVARSLQPAARTPERSEGPEEAGGLERSVDGGHGDGPGAASPRALPALSEREREVAALLLEGNTYRQIGDRLFITAKTVEHHVSRMRQRLGSETRTELFADLRASLGA